MRRGLYRRRRPRTDWRAFRVRRPWLRTPLAPFRAPSLRRARGERLALDTSAADAELSKPARVNASSALLSMPVASAQAQTYTDSGLEVDS